MVEIINQSQNTVIARAEVAQTFVTRAKGLLGKKYLQNGDGLIIKPCKQIHCIGMKFTIDTVFVDKNGIVCHIHDNIKPGQISKNVKQAQYVIELPAGMISTSKTQIGDQIILELINPERRAVT